SCRLTAADCVLCPTGSLPPGSDPVSRRVASDGRVPLIQGEKARASRLGTRAHPLSVLFILIRLRHVDDMVSLRHHSFAAFCAPSVLSVVIGCAANRPLVRRNRLSHAAAHVLLKGGVDRKCLRFRHCS